MALWLHIHKCSRASLITWNLLSQYGIVGHHSLRTYSWRH